MRSNEILQRAISTYGEVASLPSVPDDLIKLTLKRRADRQQFLGKVQGPVLTHKINVQRSPKDFIGSEMFTLRNSIQTFALQNAGAGLFP